MICGRLVIIENPIKFHVINTDRLKAAEWLYKSSVSRNYVCYERESSIQTTNRRYIGATALNVYLYSSIVIPIKVRLIFIIGHSLCQHKECYQLLSSIILEFYVMIVNVIIIRYNMIVYVRMPWLSRIVWKRLRWKLLNCSLSCALLLLFFFCCFRIRSRSINVSIDSGDDGVVVSLMCFCCCIWVLV